MAKTQKMSFTREQAAALLQMLMADAPAATPATPSLQLDGRGLPGWVADAVAAKAPGTKVEPATPQPPAPRTWTRGAVADSRSGRPFVTFHTTTKNGSGFRVGVPLDLVAAIKAGL